MTRPGVSENDLHAYIDGELSPERREAVERHLAEHADAAEAVDAFRRQNETIRALYGHVADEPVPPRLDVHRLAARRATASSRTWQGTAAAAILCLAIGAAGGWFGRGYWASQMPASLVDEAVIAHSIYSREVAHPVEVRADEQEHLTRWLSKRLDRPLVVPDLRSVGFDLVGGRLLPAQGGPAAQLMYEDASGQRVTFLIVPASDGDESSLRYAELDGLRSFLWSERSMNYIVVGSPSREQLRDIATQAYQQLS